MRLIVLLGLAMLGACSFIRSSQDAPKPAPKAGGMVEMTCYQDCRNDLQTDEFCRSRCED